MTSDCRAHPFDPGLQPERTALAWRRTGLALTAGSLIALRVLPHALGTWALLPVGLGVVLSVLVLVASHQRYRVHHHRLTTSPLDRIHLPDGALLALVAMITLGGGCGAFAVVISLGYR
jgi:uncharacterized membrane protein YidH (DUF202 family)